MKLLYTQDGFGGLTGPTLVLDIDLLITGDLDCFFDGGFKDLMQRER